MQPTRAFLDGVLKYKRLRSQVTGKNHFIYDEQRECLKFLYPRGREIKLHWKSIECQIMDWADDVAYSIGDFVDGVRARFITIQKLKDWNGTALYPPLISKLLDALQERTITNFAADKIGQFIQACELVETNDTSLASLSNRYQYRLEVKGVVLPAKTGHLN